MARRTLAGTMSIVGDEGRKTKARPIGTGLSLPKTFADVLVAGIWKDRDDDAGAEALRDAQGGHGGGASRNADEQAFLARQAAGHGVGVLGGHRQVFVGQAVVVDTGHDGGGHVLEAFQAVKSRIGLEGDQTNIWVERTERAPRANEGAAGAQP